MLAKPSTQLTMHTHPSAGVFNPLKFALSHEEEEEVVCLAGFDEHAIRLNSQSAMEDLSVSEWFCAVD